MESGQMTLEEAIELSLFKWTMRTNGEKRNRFNSDDRFRLESLEVAVIF
jgi:hypothetical protein